MIHAAFLIPLFPLVGYAVLAPFGRRLGNPLAGWIATAMVAASFVTTILVFASLAGRAPDNRSYTENWWTWFSVDRLHVTAGILVDPLSLTMALFVTGVSTLIHLYSIGYMEHDGQFPKFFMYLNLFVASMLLLVLGGNFVMTFLGWEGVGVCSYFLIAFWFDRPTAASAGKKAMIFNRIGDAGFLLAMFLIFERTGSLQYQTVFARLGHVGEPSLVAIALLLFLGAAGKSAQLPLYPWLADAMEGPTPVSALIHAATMVTSGVYLMCRISPILYRAPDAAHVVAIVGGCTAFLGATIACAQTDIKKILAYSTISQLGYMFMAAGVGAYVAAIFLMLTHAFYKALLFLGAGSVIHAMNDEQNTKVMGGLRKVMPITAITFMIAWLSIGGFPLLSGFWSKGDVLLNAYGFSPALYGLGALTAVLTAYYLGRCYMLVFSGQARWVEARPSGDGHGASAVGAEPALASGHGHESSHGHGPLDPHDPSWVMTVPLVVLAFCSVFGGLINLPFHPRFVFLEHWLNPVVGATLFNPHLGAGSEVLFGVVDGVLALAGIGLAYSLWRTAVSRPELEPAFLQRAWYIDFGYDRLLARTSTLMAGVMATVVDNKIIDGAVNGIGSVFRASGGVYRRVQTGYVRNYALGIMGGLVVLLAYVLTRTVS
ncbi:MAG: NADH-quinone oxidoreductase subunit L [Acidimicrobiales bacterium]